MFSGAVAGRWGGGTEIVLYIVFATHTSTGPEGLPLHAVPALTHACVSAPPTPPPRLPLPILRPLSLISVAAMGRFSCLGFSLYNMCRLAEG